MANGSLQRFLGGSPGSVLVRLIFLSVLGGAAMAVFGVTPMRLGDGVVRFAREMLAGSFAMLGEVGRWLLYGAMVVVPIWLVLRVLDLGKR